MSSIFLYYCVDLKENENHFVLLILLMSNLFTYRLGVAALLATSLVSLATDVFLIFEQTSQIKALQETLHYVCLKAVSDQIQGTDSTL